MTKLTSAKSNRRANPRRPVWHSKKQAWRPDPNRQLRDVFDQTLIQKGNATLDAMQALWRARDAFKHVPLEKEELRNADALLRDLQMKLLATGIGEHYTLTML